MRDVFYDVFVMSILRFFAVIKLLQLIEGHSVTEAPIKLITIIVHLKQDR